MTTDEAQDIFPAWSPDGSGIAFASNRTGAWELHILSTADGKVRQLTHFGAVSSVGERLGVWSLDGQAIYVALAPGPKDRGREIWAISVEDGSKREILENRNERVYGALERLDATDGERIYFTMLSGAVDLWLAELAYE